MSAYDRVVGRSGGHTADGLGSTRSSGADKFNAAMAAQVSLSLCACCCCCFCRSLSASVRPRLWQGDLGMTGKEMLDAMRNVVLHGPTGRVRLALALASICPSLPLSLSLSLSVCLSPPVAVSEGDSGRSPLAQSSGMQSAAESTVRLTMTHR